MLSLSHFVFFYPVFLPCASCVQALPRAKDTGAGTDSEEAASSRNVDPRLLFNIKGVISSILPDPFETDPVVQVTWPEGEQDLPDVCRLSNLVYANEADVRML